MANLWGVVHSFIRWFINFRPFSSQRLVCQVFGEHLRLGSAGQAVWLWGCWIGDWVPFSWQMITISTGVDDIIRAWHYRNIQKQWNNLLTVQDIWILSQHWMMGRFTGSQPNFHGKKHGFTRQGQTLPRWSPCWWYGSLAELQHNCHRRNPPEVVVSHHVNV